MSTTPPMIRLARELERLQTGFELTDMQFASLPALEDIELVPQSDSHRINHATTTTYTYHPYKLFIGKRDDDPFYVYLYRAAGSTKQCKIEITGVDASEGIHRTPYEATYYGSVRNLAYPFNTFLGAARFVAVVKWYSLLGLRTGLFGEDPGFVVSSSWRKDLQGACNELLAATEREDKDKEKATGRERFKEAREMQGSEARRSFATEQRPAEVWKVATTAKSRKLAAPSSDGSVTATGNANNSPNNVQDTQSRRYSSDARFSSTLTKDDRRRENEATAQMAAESRIPSQTIASTNEESMKRAQRMWSVPDKTRSAMGRSDNDRERSSKAAPKQSSVRNARRRADDRGDRAERTGPARAADDEMEIHPRAAEYLELYRQRQDINKRLRVIQDEMTPEQHSNVLDQV